MAAKIIGAQDQGTTRTTGVATPLNLTDSAIAAGSFETGDTYVVLYTFQVDTNDNTGHHTVTFNMPDGTTDTHKWEHENIGYYQPLGFLSPPCVASGSDGASITLNPPSGDTITAIDISIIAFNLTEIGAANYVTSTETGQTTAHGTQISGGVRAQPTMTAEEGDDFLLLGAVQTKVQANTLSFEVAWLDETAYLTRMLREGEDVSADELWTLMMAVQTGVGAGEQYWRLASRDDATGANKYMGHNLLVINLTDAFPGAYTASGYSGQVDPPTGTGTFDTISSVSSPAATGDVAIIGWWNNTTAGFTFKGRLTVDGVAVTGGEHGTEIYYDVTDLQANPYAAIATDTGSVTIAAQVQANSTSPNFNDGSLVAIQMAAAAPPAGGGGGSVAAASVPLLLGGQD